MTVADFIDKWRIDRWLDRPPDLNPTQIAALYQEFYADTYSLIRDYRHELTDSILNKLGVHIQ